MYAVVCFRSTRSPNGLIALVIECLSKSSVSAYIYQKGVLPYHKNPVSLVFFPAISEFPVTKSEMSVSIVPGFFLVCSIYVASSVHCPFICVTIFVWVSYLWMWSTFLNRYYWQGSHKNWPYISFIMNTTWWTHRQPKWLPLNSE
jgi:hypothetical protein